MGLRTTQINEVGWATKSDVAVAPARTGQSPDTTPHGRRDPGGARRLATPPALDPSGKGSRFGRQLLQGSACLDSRVPRESNQDAAGERIFCGFAVVVGFLLWWAAMVLA